ncbi:MAG: type IV pilin protein [Microcystaceae cyanobacterium]
MNFLLQMCLKWRRRFPPLQKQSSGFTLLELMITVMIASILTLMSYPIVLNQIGKARVAEARNGLGSINRAQQAYLFEYSQFAPSIEILRVQFALGKYQGGNFVTKYYIYSVTNAPNNSEIYHRATPIDGSSYNTRTLASAVYHQPSFFASVVCEATTPSGIPNITDPETCNNGHFIR